MCACMAGNMAATVFLLYETESERRRKIKCVCDLSVSSERGSTRRWPIVGRNDIWLYLALQTACEMMAASNFSHSIHPLSFHCLISGLILLVLTSLTGTALLFQMGSFCHLLTPL